MIDNYPIAFARPILRRIVFPLGANEIRPNDRLGHKVAALMLSPSETRDRLTRGCYKSDREGYVIGNMEALLPDVIAAEPLERRMLKALRADKIKGLTFEEQVDSAVDAKVLTADEKKFLLGVRERVLEVIAVDDFDIRELQAGLSDTGESIRDAA